MHHELDGTPDAMFALEFINYWDIYFAGRAASLGLVTAEVVDALFYNFAPVRWPDTFRRCGAPC